MNNIDNTPNYYAIIPAIVRYNKKLKANEKLLYAEITALTNKEGFCWAKNEYFAKLYNVDRLTISRWISNLEKEKLIKVKIIYKNNTKEILLRKIYILDTCSSVKPIHTDTPIDEKINTPIDEKINTLLTKKSIGGGAESIVNNSVSYCFFDLNTTSNNKREEEGIPLKNVNSLEIYNSLDLDKKIIISELYNNGVKGIDIELVQEKLKVLNQDHFIKAEERIENYNGTIFDQKELFKLVLWQILTNTNIKSKPRVKKDKKNNPENMTNYQQREYDDEYFDNLLPAWQRKRE